MRHRVFPSQAGVRHLVLVHYDVKSDPADLMAEAQSTFDGQVSVPQDLDEFKF